mmetsp:Transcript_18972/g.57358  ORF Transcript_18972/g.57358 Transcript_18972/m.57358 type:complete len:82 (+) Transcript_18972:2370-2615(+)
MLARRGVDARPAQRSRRARRPVCDPRERARAPSGQLELRPARSTQLKPLPPLASLHSSAKQPACCVGVCDPRASSARYFPP